MALKPVPEGPPKIARRFNAEVGETEGKSVPEGRLKDLLSKARRHFIRAYGTDVLRRINFPRVELAGYCRWSLRDRLRHEPKAES